MTQAKIGAEGDGVYLDENEEVRVIEEPGVQIAEYSSPVTCINDIEPAPAENLKEKPGNIYDWLNKNALVSLAHSEDYPGIAAHYLFQGDNGVLAHIDVQREIHYLSNSREALIYEVRHHLKVRSQKPFSSSKLERALQERGYKEGNLPVE